MIGFEEFVWFALAVKDQMSDTSLGYWFRVLDADEDGFLSVDDCLLAHQAKEGAMRGPRQARWGAVTTAALPLRAAKGAPAALSDSTTPTHALLPRPSPSPPGGSAAVAVAATSAAAAAAAASRVFQRQLLLDFFDLVGPTVPNKLSMMDIRRAGAGRSLFLLLLAMDTGPLSPTVAGGAGGAGRPSWGSDMA